MSHQPTVDLFLVANGQVFSLAQIGPNRVELVEPHEMEPMDAEIVMAIDGHETRWSVRVSGANGRNVEIVDHRFRDNQFEV